MVRICTHRVIVVPLAENRLAVNGRMREKSSGMGIGQRLIQKWENAREIKRHGNRTEVDRKAGSCNQNLCHRIGQGLPQLTPKGYRFGFLNLFYRSQGRLFWVQVGLTWLRVEYLRRTTL